MALRFRVGARVTPRPGRASGRSRSDRTHGGRSVASGIPERLLLVALQRRERDAGRLRVQNPLHLRAIQLVHVGKDRVQLALQAMTGVLVPRERRSVVAEARRETLDVIGRVGEFEHSHGNGLGPSHPASGELRQVGFRREHGQLLDDVEIHVHAPHGHARGPVQGDAVHVAQQERCGNRLSIGKGQDRRYCRRRSMGGSPVEMCARWLRS